MLVLGLASPILIDATIIGIDYSMEAFCEGKLYFIGSEEYKKCLKRVEENEKFQRELKETDEARKRERERVNQINNFFSEARLLFKDNRYKESLDKFKDILEIDPGNEYAEKGVISCKNAIQEKEDNRIKDMIKEELEKERQEIIEEQEKEKKIVALRETIKQLQLQIIELLKLQIALMQKNN